MLVQSFVSFDVGVEARWEKLFVERTPVAQCLDPRRETRRNDKVLWLYEVSGNVENCLPSWLPRDSFLAPAKAVCLLPGRVLLQLIRKRLYSPESTREYFTTFLS